MFVDISEKMTMGVYMEFHIILTCLILIKPQGISIIIFTLWLRKLRHREVKELSQHHIVKWSKQEIHLGSLLQSHPCKAAKRFSSLLSI